jgi:hypothetical protein
MLLNKLVFASFEGYWQHLAICSNYASSEFSITWVIGHLYVPTMHFYSALETNNKIATIACAVKEWGGHIYNYQAFCHSDVIFKNISWKQRLKGHWHEKSLSNKHFGACHRFKGIVSWDWRGLLMVSVDRYNILDIAGKYLFYILKSSSYLKFKF